MIRKLPSKFALTILAFFISFLTVSAQVSLREISLKEQISNSSLVVEGKVVAKRSFWDADHRLIYTANTVEVYKVFKGEPIQTIEVLTIGGVVGLRALVVSHSLKLREGSLGVFTLYDSDVSVKKVNKTTKQYKTYSSSQGFYKYNLKHNVALNPFGKKQGIQSSFYNEIMSLTKSKYINIADFDINKEYQKFNKSNDMLVLGITDFLPTTATAGTGFTITINGTDFGGTQGKVGFANADSGGMSMGMPDYIDALDSQVTTWNNTQIVVEVPSSAGTGKIRVTHDDTSTTESATDLIITYAEINVETDVGSGMEAFATQHYDDNGSGGYTWEMQTDFFNDTEHPGAKASFMRAFDTWRCETKINWEVSGSATTTDVIGIADLVEPFDGELDADGENVIRFDNGSELSAGTLGTCYSWYSGRLCTPAVWWVTDLDIVFNDSVDNPDTPGVIETWYFGTGSPGADQFDFETVALHELGHGHQLGHVIDGSNVMHYALPNNTSNTTLDSNSISGANDVQSRSTTNMVCGTPSIDLMTNYGGSCGLNVGDIDLENGIAMYPNPAKKQLFIENSSSEKVERVVIFDVSGRLISDIDVSETSSTKTINLSNASKGMYFVNIYSGTNLITKKLIVE